jgi:DNA topoisomerase-2
LWFIQTCLRTTTSLGQRLTGLLKKAKAKPGPKKAAASKVPKSGAKKLVQTTLKTTKPATKKRPKPGSDEDDEPSNVDIDSMQDASLLSNTPPSSKKQKKGPAKKGGGKPLQDIANESMNFDGGADPKPMKKKDATDQYQKLTQLEHIIKRPDTYIGSVERADETMWVFNSETSQMELRKVSFVPGLYKIFDEILVNAADNKQRDPSMKVIKVVVDRENGQISVENDGAGIPIEIHKVSSTGISQQRRVLTALVEREDIHSRDDLWPPSDWIQLRR